LKHIGNYNRDTGYNKTEGATFIFDLVINGS